MRWSNLNKWKTLRILMRNVYFSQHRLHQCGEIFDWGIHKLCICLMPIIACWFGNVVSLLLPAGPYWGSESLCRRHFVFWVLMKFTFQRKITLGGAFNTGLLSEMDVQFYVSKKGWFMSCLITLETFLYSLINSLYFHWGQTLPLKITWYPLPLVRCQVFGTFPKHHYSCRWPIEVVSSSVNLNCLFLQFRYLEERLLIVPSSGDCDILFKNIFILFLGLLW